MPAAHAPAGRVKMDVSIHLEGRAMPTERHVVDFDYEDDDYEDAMIEFI